MILQLSDFWLNIGGAIEQFIEQIGSWNWNNILEYFKNISLGGVSLTILGLFIKLVIPLLKNSNKKTFQKLGELYDKIDSLENKEQTISNILKEWIALQSEVNAKSVTLKPEYKMAFSNLAQAMRLVDDENVKEAANKIDEIIEDNKVSAEEMQDLIESTEIGEIVMGTNINDILPKVE